ncbi:decaprenyl-phosphate phosphoribosyltransferase [Chloroflexota bacterium]
MVKSLFETLRIRQWTKNVLVFFALIFDKQLFDPVAFLRTSAGFLLFCLLSSAVYIFNDLADLESDRQHPEKKNRPIASGRLPVRTAWTAGILLVLMAIPAGYLLSPLFAGVLIAYLVLILVYSKWLKHIPIVDVMVIAAGFVLRVQAGVTLISIERFSPWLYVVTTLGALYLGFGKRRAELALLAGNAGTHRRVLNGYSIALLDQFILIVSSTTLVAYSLYTFSAPNLPENHSMMLTIPFVLYGIFRYLFLVQSKHSGGAPEEVLLSDRPLQLTILLWGITILGVFYL